VISVIFTSVDLFPVPVPSPDCWLTAMYARLRDRRKSRTKKSSTAAHPTATPAARATVSLDVSCVGGTVTTVTLGALLGVLDVSCVGGTVTTVTLGALLGVCVSQTKLGGERRSVTPGTMAARTLRMVAEGSSVVSLHVNACLHMPPETVLSHTAALVARKAAAADSVVYVLDTIVRATQHGFAASRRREALVGGHCCVRAATASGAAL
jgi:hypothetical protein